MNNPHLDFKRDVTAQQIIDLLNRRIAQYDAVENSINRNEATRIARRALKEILNRIADAKFEIRPIDISGD